MRKCINHSNAAIAFISIIFLSLAGFANFAIAGNNVAPEPQISQPDAKSPDTAPLFKLSRRPAPRTPLDFHDQRAALEAIHFTLREVADGSVFVWHRQKGILRGLVKPTSSFRDASGAVCRHIEFSMTFGNITRQIESIACRQNDGSWTLSG